MRSDNSNMTINYTVRPCKSVERKMMCEMISAIGEISPITDSTSRYIGMGAKFFTDFSLIHRMFGLTEMYSIEKSSSEEDIKRFEFNKPYNCITMIFQRTTDFLNSTKFPPKDKRNIIWLDYDGGFRSDMLQDVQISVKKSSSFSLIFVTMNIDFGSKYKAACPSDKLEIFNIRVGNDNYTKNVRPKDLAGDGLIRSIIKIFNLAIEEALLDINSGERGENDLQCKQIACFKYADSQAPMLTIGWITYYKNEIDTVNNCKIKKLDYYNETDSPYDISVPPLTLKEVGVLNRNLPNIQLPVPGAEFLTKDEVTKYSKIYRYYPALTESNMVL